MPQPVQSRTRVQLRADIGRTLGLLIAGAATSTVDSASLLDTYGLAKGGDGEYNGRQVVIITPTGSIVAGEKSWVASFASATSDATVAPVFSSSITTADTYEMWLGVTYEEVNAAIDLAIMKATNEGLQISQVNNVWTEEDKLEYDLASTTKGLVSVEFVKNTGIDHLIENCDTVWSELVDTDVTATADTSFKKQGNASLKLVVAAGAAAGDILATQAIGSTDLSDSDTLEVWIYSSVALDAGDLDLLLDNTALCASAVESLDIPATTAATWTRHLISLANPASDSAVISVGVQMTVDKGAFTLYVDDIRGVLAGSREYEVLHRDHWNIIKGSTNKLKLTPRGLDYVGKNTLLRENGMKIPSLLTADSSTSEIDPAWVLAEAVAYLLRSNAKATQLDIQGRRQLADDWQKIADRMWPSVLNQYTVAPRWV